MGKPDHPTNSVLPCIARLTDNRPIPIMSL